MVFDPTTNTTQVDEGIAPNSKSCALDIFYYMIVCAAFLSLVDGLATLFFGKNKSLSSILLFAKDEKKNIGTRNFIFNDSDLTSGLSEKRDEDVNFFLYNEVQYIPENNFSSSELPRIKENVKEWNMRQSDKNFLIKLGTDEMVRNRAGCFSWTLCHQISVPFKEWNDQYDYESRGPMSGVRVWKTRFAIFGLQFKYGDTWAEIRGRKSYFPWCGCSCCLCSNERRIQIEDMELGREERISKVKTKTSRFNGRLLRMEITTTLGRTFSSHKGKQEPIWNNENWPHNIFIQEKESLILAYCSGLDEESKGGLGKLLNFHWIKFRAGGTVRENVDGREEMFGDMVEH